MANSYTPYRANTEQDVMVILDAFLVNKVGWYRVATVTDTSSDRDYVFKSEGTDPTRGPVVVRIRGVSNDIQFDMYETWDDDTGIGTNILGDITSDIELLAGVLKGYLIANKERIVISAEENIGEWNSGYVGRLESFYSADNDPYPYIIRGSSSSAQDWTANNNIICRDPNGTSASYILYFGTNYVTNAGNPNPRTGQFTFYRPIVYRDAGGQTSNEIRGKIIGAYLGDTNRLANRSFVTIGGSPHIALKTQDQEDVMVFGPITEDGEIPAPQLTFPTVIDTTIDYDLRGLIKETTSSGTPTVSGTLVLWRFDEDETGVYKNVLSPHNLLPQNSPVLDISPLQKAVEFDGINQYATVTGDTTVSGVLLSEWTCESVFYPNDISATTSGTLVEFGSDGEIEKNNVLLSVGHGLNGSVEVLWEKDSGEDIRNTTTSGVVVKKRWNYLAVVKRPGPVDYDVEVWHCSFGDFRTPKLITTFSGVENSTGGENNGSSWFVGTDVTLTNFFDGRQDDIRVTKRAITQGEIETSCSRTIL